MGRTGIRGRGLLGRWGPNHAGDPIVTRLEIIIVFKLQRHWVLGNFELLLLYIFDCNIFAFVIYVKLMYL